MRHRSLLCFAFLAVASVSASSAMAGERSCDLRFHVRDAETQAPLAATVTVVDVRSGWTRTRQANERGHTTFHGIRPDTGYQGKGHQAIEVSAPGYVSQRFEGVKCPLASAVKGRVQLERAP